MNESSENLPRVLYVTDLHPSLKFGSLDEQIFVLARAFRERGGLFLPLFGAPLEAQAATRYEAANLATASLNLYRFNYPTLRRLLQIIRQHAIELIDWNFYSPVNPYVVALTVLLPRLQHYYTDHSSRPANGNNAPAGVKRMLKKVLLKRYRRVLCISDFLVKYLEQQKIWSNLSRCDFFINTERFQPDAGVRSSVREQMNAQESFIVLTVANLNPGKGVDVAIRALAKVSEQAVLWIVGDGQERERLRAFADELGLAGRVQFLGHQLDVGPYMKAADCFVCPSVEAEAMGFVNLEALATQLPVIASATGGIPEFVEDGRTGFLFPPGDHQLLADKINLLMRDKETYRRLALNARARAVERFSIESRLPAYLQLYRSAMHG